MIHCKPQKIHCKLQMIHDQTQKMNCQRQLLYQTTKDKFLHAQKINTMAFPTVMHKAGAVLLEPIMKVEVTMPEEYMGDIMGDLNSRRGRIEGMEDIGGGKMVKAYVPLAEMFGYSTDLRSRTQGRGNYSMFFEKYEPVPKSIQEKVLNNKDK